MNKIIFFSHTLRKTVFAACICAMSTLSLFAQGSITVSGTVNDETGSPLPGVNIVVKGTLMGVISDANGAYSVSVAGRESMLIFSFMGYATQEIVVGDRTSIRVIMREDAQALEEVVVIGYGTLEKKQVTSSITSLSARDLPQGVGGSSIATALQGKVGGLVMSGTASPNSGNTFQLRGMASINTSRAPLIVIDGMPGGDVRTLVQEDIQSIDVLKDASAGAIYGTRATGGVILITTKQAKPGALKMSYTGEMLFKQSFGKPDLLNAADYIATYAGAKNNEGHDTDWWDEAMNDSPTSNRHVLTLQGGSESARLYATAMYDDNRGVLRGDRRKDYSGRINGDFKVLDGWLDISTHVSYRQALRNQNKPSVEGIMRANPTQAVYDPESQTGYNIWTTGDNTEMNEIGEAALRTDEGLDKWFRPDVSLKLNILPVKGLSYRHTVAYENRQWERHFYRSMFSREEQRAGRKGWAEMEFSKTELLNTDGYFSYINEFGNHYVNAVAGYSYFEQNSEGFSAKNGDFTNDLVMFWNLGEGSRLKDGLAEMASAKGITQRLLAYFARANYSYRDRYMATVSVRREGSSKFAEKNRWGTFWSASAGWRLSEESFLQDVVWVNDLKLRLAYGVTGNEGFSADYAATMYGSDTRWLLPDGTWAYTYGVTKNVNDMLGWEEKHEWNVGVDFSLFDNRFYGKFDLYRRAIEGLIYSVQVPQPPNTESEMYKNIGTMENKGWEIEAGGDIIRSNNWNYSSSVNLSHNRTIVGSLWGDQTYINGAYINNWVEYVHRLEENVEVGSFFTYRYAGISDDGKIQIYDRDNNIISTDDGKVDDRVYQKSFMPTIIAGWSHNLSYKNWSLGVTLTSWIDYDLFDAIELEYGLRNVVQGNMLYDAINKNAKITGRPSPCDYFLYDATFLKIQNFSLSYTLPMKRYTRIMDSARIYLTGNNLYTFTKYPGLNPEENITGWDAGIEKKGNIYPQTRTFALGLQLNF
ncbi:MAG: SusC/RagA family TonB-linked outer membrane protein [Bacteroidales bacterium]|jgi:TonB-linked SusC/RagA family outer membrane protein|nr:SusC/RagA family TonB-linked outer membrane protein [Bacteroidales bacterium]